MRIRIDIAPGEALDKLSILAIKEDRLKHPAQLGHVRREAAALRDALAPLLRAVPALPPLMAALRTVNERLWEVEEALRAHERRGDFGPEFVRLAREVYRTNDRRAALKAEINALLGTDIAEQKSYAP